MIYILQKNIIKVGCFSCISLFVMLSGCMPEETQTTNRDTYLINNHVKAAITHKYGMVIWTGHRVNSANIGRIV
jgi:hypothetical protein